MLTTVSQHFVQEDQRIDLLYFVKMSIFVNTSLINFVLSDHVSHLLLSNLHRTVHSFSHPLRDFCEQLSSFDLLSRQSSHQADIEPSFIEVRQESKMTTTDSLSNLIVAILLVVAFDSEELLSV